MTKIYKTILNVSLLLLGVKVNAQVAPYAFTQTSGAYTAITGGTVYGTTTTDDDVFVDPANPVGDPSGSQGVGLPIGFNFTYNGTIYDVFGIDNNGWISFGQSSSSPGVDMDVSSYAAMISSTSFALPTLQNRIAGFNRDLQGQAGSSVRVQNLGVSPNQTLVVQFENYREFNITGDIINFQIRLMETSNIVEVVYGSNTFANTSSAEVGLRGTTNADFNNRNVPATGSWAASTAGVSNGDVANYSSTLTPTSGQIYRWSPPPPCTGVPNAGTVTGSQTICPNTTAVVTNTSSNSFTGISYQWMQAPSATGPWTNVTTGSGYNSQSLTTTSLTSLTFYQLVITCSNSAQSATTAVTSVNPNSPATQCYCNQNLGGSNCSGDNITNVTILSTPLNNNSGCNTNANGTYTQFTPGPTTTATLNIAVTYTISVNTTANNIESVWIDYDHSGTFDVSEHTQICLSSVANSATTMTFTIPGSAQLGLTGMRVRSRGTGNQNGPPDACLTFGSGETEDYFVTIAAGTPCAGAPGANSAVATLTSVCPNGTTTLSLANTYTVGGLAYQWYSSSSVSGPYTAVSGATNIAYPTPSLTSSTYYEAVITCTNGPASTTSTPVQIVVSSNPCQCGAYCASNATYNLYDEIFNVSIGTLNNTSSCSQTGGPGSLLNEYSNYSGIVAAPSLTAASSYSLSVTVGMCGVTFNNSGIVTAFMDFNNNGSFTDPGEAVFTSTYTSFNVAGTTVGGMVNIPATANPGITRMRIVEVESSTAMGSCGTYFAGETEDYCVNIAPAAPCAGTPGANSAVASMTNVCPSGSVSLSLANSYTVGGLTYQWYSSSSVSGPYTAITGATTNIYGAANLTSTLYYEAVITCTNGPASTTSTPVQVIVGGSPCQCAGYCLTSFPSFTNDDEIFNVSIGTLNNTSNCSMTGGPTSTLNLYSNYAGIVTSPNLAAGISYTLSVTVGQCNGNVYSGGVTAYMDFNQNGSFSDPGEQVYASGINSWAVLGTTQSVVVTIPVNATLGTTRLRVIASEGITAIGECTGYGYGETEDYCITITPPTPCAGAPASNTAIASQANVCPTGSVGLSLANSYTIGGLTYQWYSAASVTGPYTAISGATTSAYVATNLSTSLYYEAVITCTNGPASTTSTPVQVTVNSNPCQCGSYCTSNATSTFYDEIFNVSIGTLNNTSSCSQTGGPTSILNEYSNYAGLVAAPNLAGASNYTLSVTVGMCNTTFGNSGIVTAYMDFNANGSFTDPGETVFTSSYTAFAVAGTTVTGVVNIPATATSGITRMRIVEVESTIAQGSCGTYFAGETEDYCINITPAPPCAGNPAANTSVASSTFVCSGGSSTLSLANTYTVGGLTFQWYSAPNSTGPYIAITGANSAAYTATNITAAAWYEAVITCTNGPASTTATPVQITILGAPVYATVPFLENFDNQWQNRCDIDNVPVAANWNDNPTTGNQSWRRQDDGISANWTAATSFTVAPLTGAGCADFHTWYAPIGTSGDLSLYVNMGSTSAYAMSFWYNNASGNDSLEVFLSTNGGISFTKQSAYFVSSTWSQKTLTFTPNSATCVIKFTATSDYGASDIGIDSLKITTTCAVPNLTLAASQTTVCNGVPVNLTASGALTYTWSTGANTSSISVTPSVTTAYSVTGQNAPGCPTTKTVNITVTPGPTLTYSATPGLTLCPGMTATLSAASSAGTYTWGPGGQNTSAITVTPNISTVYNVASTNSLGCTTNSNITVFVVVCTGLSNNSIVDNNSFIYPNPNSGNINVVIANSNGNYSFEIMDITGRIVYVSTLTTPESAVDIKELAKGMYTFKITSLTTKTAIKEGKLIKE